MFKRSFLRVFLSLSILLCGAAASDFTKAATVTPQLVQKGTQKEWCPVCGMSISGYYKTSHASKLHNGEDRQYCSMRCLAVDMQNNEIHTDSIMVVDAASQKLIPAKSAFYVVGSDIRGTMTRVSKIAFADKETAEDFSIEHGGDIVDFDEALKTAQDSLEADMAMVQKKKEKQIYEMGKKIFEKRCKEDMALEGYAQINALKAALKQGNGCEGLKEKELQPLALYLWEVKRAGGKQSAETISVSKEEKCPVCGMFVYKYPKWAAQIFYGGERFSFDGAKDMMKYYFSHKDGITKMLVSDYYSQKAIDAKSAYYVVGSDIYGPMGEELIPFASKEEAKAFYMDHKASRILAFDEITKEWIAKLDK